MEEIKEKDIKQNNTNIIEKIKKCTCSILDSNSSGFFCKIPFFGQSRYLNILLVNYDSINYNVDDDEYPSITILLNNDDLLERHIILNEGRKKIRKKVK